MLDLIPKWDPIFIHFLLWVVSCEVNLVSFFGHPEAQGAAAPLLLAVAAVSEQLAKDQSSDWNVLESNETYEIFNFFPGNFVFVEVISLGPSSSKPRGEKPQVLQEMLSDEVRMPRNVDFLISCEFMSLMADVCQKHKNCGVFDSTKVFATLFSCHPSMVVMGVLCRCLQHHKIEYAQITMQSSVSGSYLCQRSM